MHTVLSALLSFVLSAAAAAESPVAQSAARIEGLIAPVGTMNLIATFDGARAPAGDPLAAAEPTKCSAPLPPLWNKVPGQTITPIETLDQLQFGDPNLAKVAEAAGHAYDKLRENEPKGRLGGRKEAFTQRDLTNAWALSFRKNFLQLVGSAVPAPLASLAAYYVALEYSYGRGMDYDPASPEVGDRAKFETVALELVKSLAVSLGLMTGQETDVFPTPLAVVDTIAKRLTNKVLYELREAASGVDVSHLLAATEPLPGTLGGSGALTRDLEQMNRNFMMEVTVDGKTERIETAWKLVEQVDEAAQLNQVVSLVGPTGTGKSMAVKWLAANNGIPHLTVAMKPAIGQGEMVGSVRPTPIGLAWQWGFLIKAMIQGDWVTLEEVNLAPSEVLEFLNEFLNSGFLRLTQFLDPETLETVLPKELFETLKADGYRLKAHPRFRLFFTMNPDTYSGRNPLSKTLLNRTVQMWAPEYSPREMQLIVRARTGIDGGTALNLVENLYQGLRTAIGAGQVGAEHKDRYEVNLRTLIRAVDLYKENLEQYQAAKGLSADDKTAKTLLGRALWESLGSMMRGPEDRRELWTLIDLSFGMKGAGIELASVQPKVQAVRFDAATQEVVFEDELLPFRIPVKAGGTFVPPENFGLPPTPAVMNGLYWMARRIKLRQNFLLVGNTAAGKTTQIQFLHRMLNAAVYYTSLSSDSANEEVEGGYQPAPHKAGKFAWIPGKLQKAGEEYGGQGSTLFIDEFNMNGLVEMINTPLDDGMIVTPEGVKRLGPDTLVVGAMNPPGYQSRNMLSPAVRGRFWEMWVEEPDSNEAALRVGWRLKQLMGDQAPGQGQGK
ncbi:MAG: AAA family ATPase [Elusimicrobia bacterium]|nr:AAA family ATPase [Elusimicrobiota bacterium]